MRTRKHDKHIRLSDGEYAALCRNAKLAGLSHEAYIRGLIMGYCPREQSPADYYGMTKALHAIGNRMNQIAARANATGFFLAEEYAAQARALHEQIMNIRAAVEQRDNIKESEEKK